MATLNQAWPRAFCGFASGTRAGNSPLLETTEEKTANRYWPVLRSPWVLKMGRLSLPPDVDGDVVGT